MVLLRAGAGTERLSCRCCGVRPALQAKWRFGARCPCGGWAADLRQPVWMLGELLPLSVSPARSCGCFVGVRRQVGQTLAIRCSCGRLVRPPRSRGPGSAGADRSCGQLVVLRRKRWQKPAGAGLFCGMLAMIRQRRRWSRFYGCYGPGAFPAKVSRSFGWAVWWAQDFALPFHLGQHPPQESRPAAGAGCCEVWFWCLPQGKLLHFEAQKDFSPLVE